MASAATGPFAVIDPVVYRGRPIVVYRVGFLSWNARVKDPSWNFRFGNPFDSMTPDRALAKAKRWVDQVEQKEAIERALNA